MGDALVGSEAVSVEIYDWGDGVSNYNNMNHLTASNHIALLSFMLTRTPVTSLRRNEEMAEPYGCTQGGIAFLFALVSHRPGLPEPAVGLEKHSDE